MTTLSIGTFSSWNIWSVKTVEKTIIGLAGAVFIYTMYLMIWGMTRGMTKGPAPKKITTTHFPPERLNALGFIKIFHDYIGSTDRVIEVKAMIEDANGRRIATRYMTRFVESADIVAQLPLNQDVFVRLKVTRRDQGHKDVVSPIRFKVDQAIGVYTLSKRRVSDSIALTEVQSNPPEWKRPSNEPKTFRSMNVTCQEMTPNYQNIYQKPDGIAVESHNHFYKLVKINLFTNLDSTQLKAPLFYCVDGQEIKLLELKWLIKDLKAAYKQEKGKRILHQEGNDSGNFYIEAMSYSSYQV
jgi:hypothetical protein